MKFDKRRRRLAIFFVFCALLVGAEIAMAGRRAFTRTEGQYPIAVDAFNDGVPVTHAFPLPDGGLTGVSVRIVSDRPASLHIAGDLLALYDSGRDAADERFRYTPIYRWSTVLKVPAGSSWQRLDFAPIVESAGQWHAVEVRLLDATADKGPGSGRPSVSLMVSEDNPPRGGKLWIGETRQPGSMFIRTHGANRYDRLRISIAPRLPWLMRQPLVYAAGLVWWHAAIFGLVYLFFFSADSKDGLEQPAMVSHSAATRLSSQLAVLGVGTCGLFVPLLVPLLTRRVLAFQDLVEFHLPVRYLFAKAMQAADSVLWTPALFSGFDLYGEGQVGMAHPFHFALYRWLPLDLAFNIELISSYVVGLIGMRCLLKRFEYSAEAAWFGAIVFAFSGFNLLHLSHMNVIAVVSHAPWLLLATHVLLTSNDQKPRAIAFAAVTLLIASQLLLGHHQFVWITGLAVAYLALCVAVSRNAWSRFAILAGAVVLGVGIAAVQLLPTLDTLSESWRAAPSLPFRLSWSLPVVMLIQLVSPFAFKIGPLGGGEFAALHEYSVYNGAFCTLALAWLLARRRAIPHFRLVMALLALAIFSLVLSLGEYGYVYAWLAELPGLNRFRAPARHLVLFHLALSGIAGAVFQDLVAIVRRGDRLRWHRLGPVLLVAFLSLSTTAVTTFLAASPIAAESDAWFDFPRAAPGAALIVLTALLFVLAARGWRVAIPALALVTCFDLGSWGYLYSYGGGSLQTIHSLAAGADAPAGALPGELFEPKPHRYGIPDNLGVLRDLRLTTGYVALTPATTAGGDLPSLRLAGADWHLSEDGWERVPDPMARARLVSRTQTSADVAADLPNVDFSQIALVDRPIERLAGPPGSARVLADRPGRITVQTSAPDRQLLVITERFHKGWRVTEDGREIPAFRLYGMYLGCVVTAGSHSVAFSFEPSSLRAGQTVTLGGFAIALAAIFLMVRKRACEIDPQMIHDPGEERRYVGRHVTETANEMSQPGDDAAQSAAAD